MTALGFRRTRDSWKKNENAKNTNAPKAAIAQNTHGQERCCAIWPPVIGVMTIPMAVTNMTSARNLARRSRSNRSRAMATATTRAPDCATPWQNRQRISISTFWENPAPSAVSVKTANMPSTTGLRPYRSEIGPEIKNPTAFPESSENRETVTNPTVVSNPAAIFGIDGTNMSTVTGPPTTTSPIKIAKTMVPWRDRGGSETLSVIRLVGHQPAEM